MDDRISKHISKSLRYSCLHWASHLESATLDADTLDHLKHFINNLYLAWLEVLSVTKRVGLAPKMLSTLIECMEKNKQGNDKAREMYRFVTTFASVIAQSAPHIYLSALPFAPQQSVLFERYIKLFPRMLGIKSGGFDNWPPTQNVLFGHTDDVTSTSFSLDGKRIVSGSADKTVRVWDAETGQAVGAPLQGHSDVVTSVAFSPNSKRIVSGSDDKTVRLWDAETGQTVGAPFQGHDDAVTSVAFSPNGKRIVSGSWDNTVRVWDTETGQAVGAPFEGHSNTVTSVAFSPDGKRIVSGSYDKTVRLWDAETGQAVGAPFEGHRNWVTSVAFSPNGKRIVSGSYDKTVRLWDSETGQTVGAPLQGHDDAVTSVAFSPNSKRIVSGSDDRTVQTWDHKNVERDHVSLSVKSETGWILDSRSERLFWVPPHILPGLVTGGAFFIIAPFLTTTVDLSNFVYGESWVQCKERTETED
ncbi:hypothetical protein M408DRAFT_329458 [Serendipita vermifera MAFF 305830]|uniref:Uncharacterized protein n=1 Tax=Serendipita vermifera MAFF 305830 TaxID=933852 RepID=A0A0C2XGW1_SERVB|nr:hypothetical protein M408DRAFT_329458 [Serendipita vermifera MAFF 305830]